MNPRFRLTRAFVSAGNKIAVREKFSMLKSSFLKLEEESPNDERIKRLGERLEGVERRLN